DAVVALGVPDAELAEQRDGAVARRRAAAQVAERQAGLDDDADLAAVPLLARGDALLDPLQRVGAEEAARVALVDETVLEQARNPVRHHHRPEAPPPSKLPPPPELKPPLPPPPKPPPPPN